MENSNIDEEECSFDNKEIKDLKNLISQLHENEHIEILKIIKNDTDKYTENRNGIFINMSKLKNSTLINIRNFVHFCYENRKSFENNKDKMDIIKNLVSDDNKDNESFDSNYENSIENEYKEHIYKYKYNPKIEFNELENSLLKESIQLMDQHSNNKNKIKSNSIKDKIIKKSIVNNINENIINNQINNEIQKNNKNIYQKKENQINDNNENDSNDDNDSSCSYYCSDSD
jgi:hypothetical protein